MMTVLPSSLIAQVAPAIPVWHWYVTIAVVVAILVALLVVNYMTKIGVIARATIKEAVRQPVFILLIAIGVLLNVVNSVIPVFTLGEDVKMLIDCGLATLLISGLLLSAWTASTSIADEIEGKTAMTLLSKPIHRWQFVVGKYVGIVQSTGMMLLPVAVTLLGLIYYKVGYDAREAGKDVDHALKMATMWSVLPSILLIYLEVAVLSAVSVVISTRLPMLVNLVATFAIFVVGNLTPVLVQTGVLKLELVQFFAQLTSVILPSLQVYDSQVAVATGTIVNPIYLGASLFYTLCYVAAAVLLALILFEDRDLA